MPTPPDRRRRIIAVWLLFCCTAIFAMVVIGGITRLTESGLSITEWHPITGILPPLSHDAWEELYGLYRQTPEFQKLKSGMSLDEFRSIFWWEYIHRLWGRLIGLFFFAPLAVFALRGWLDARLGLKLFGIFVLGGLQGAVGWWMVQSGLIDRPDVSPYRLALHLGIAFLIHACILWVALSLLCDRPAVEPPPGLRGRARLVLAMVSLTVLAGAFVAGLDGGRIYNTFPLMAGGLVPPDYLHLQPAWTNLFENPAATQFNHRVIAIATFVAVLLFWLASRARGGPRIVHALMGMAVVQVALGIATLVFVVPLPLGVMHQAGAFVLFTLAVASLHALRAARADAALRAGRTGAATTDARPER